MPASKHFFEGYCRAKDLLHTLALRISEATITRPWTIKSEGYIINTNPRHAAKAEYHDKYHICLKRELEDGDIINFFILDDWNTPTNNIWGGVKASACEFDSFVAAEGRVSFTTNDRWKFFPYYSNQVADTEATPQFTWYWLWVDDDCLIINVFGNAGGAGTASPTRGVLYFGQAKSINDAFQDTTAINIPTRVSLKDNMLLDYVVPAQAPLSWSSEGWIVRCTDIMKIDVNSNPEADGNLTVRIPLIAQPQGQYSNYAPYEVIYTHTLGNGQYLVCPSGSVDFLKSDIVVVDELKADYINTAGTATSLYNCTDLALIKRMESAYDLLATQNGNDVELTWYNPQLCYGVKITRKLNSAPGSHDDGDEVFNLNSDTGLLINSQQVFTDTNCTLGEHYYYRAFAYDSNGTYSVPITSAQIDIQL